MLGLYRFVRKVHLWVGLALAVVLVVEAVTGLILAEPALFGAAKPQGAPGLERQQAGEGQGLQLRRRERAGGAAGGVYGVAKGLHQGRVGGVDLKWLVELSGVGLVVLSATGVYMGVVILRAGRRRE